MKHIPHALAVLCLLACGLPAHAQSDSARIDELERRHEALDKRITESILRLRASEQNTFYLYKYLSVKDTNLQRQPVTFSGYVDAYYALYTEDTPGPFVSFPTIAPRDREFGLNMVYFGAKLDLEKTRATVGLQFGDVPSSAWSTDAPFVQEANAGLRILPRLWLDAGYFRTHIGAESIQPRENICQSLANTTYFEPYFLSGAKLTWDISDRFSLQLNAFNGFNTFVETNTNMAAGLSAVYQVGEGSLVTFNTLLSDEQRRFGLAKTRLYNDLYFIHHSKRIDWCAEANLGVQGRSRLDDSTRTAVMYSFILAAKYKLGKWACAGRPQARRQSTAKA